jgi:hypothetical protein
MILGLDLWGMEEFSDDSPSLSNIKYAEFSKSIIDNISLKSSTKEKVNQKLYKSDDLQAGTIDGLVSE